MQSRQQAVQRGEAGAAAEDTVKPSTHSERPAPTGFDPVNPEVGVEFPDQATNPLLGGTLLISERVRLMHLPFRVNPAQRMLSDLELPGVITQHDGIAQQLVRLDAAHNASLGGDPDGIRRHTHRGHAEPVEVRQPCLLIICCAISAYPYKGIWLGPGAWF